MKKIFLILGMMLGGVGGAWGERETLVTDFETRLPSVDIYGNVDCRPNQDCSIDDEQYCYNAPQCSGGRVCRCLPKPVVPLPEDSVCRPIPVAYSKFDTFSNGCTMYIGKGTGCESGNAHRIVTYVCSQGCYVNWAAGTVPDCRECPSVGNGAATSIARSISIGAVQPEWVTFGGIEECYLPTTNQYEDEDGTFEIVEDKVCMY